MTTTNNETRIPIPSETQPIVPPESSSLSFWSKVKKGCGWTAGIFCGVGGVGLLGGGGMAGYVMLFGGHGVIDNAVVIAVTAGGVALSCTGTVCALVSCCLSERKEEQVKLEITEKTALLEQQQKNEQRQEAEKKAEQEIKQDLEALEKEDKKEGNLKAENILMKEKGPEIKVIIPQMFKTQEPEAIETPVPPRRLSNSK